MKISRKGFMKVAAAAAMGGVTAGALAACKNAASSSTAASGGEALYTPGTYTGTATGIGEVKVTMTFSETAITEVVVDTSKETESIGGVAAPTLQEALMAAQSAEIDNISGATVTTNAVKAAAASCIEQAMGVAVEAPVEEAPTDTSDDWLGEEPVIDSISEELDFDVVVVGAGGAGGEMGITPFLQLNLHGERFMNECIPGQQLENQIELQPECTSFQIFDSKWGEEIPYMPANHGGLCYIIPEDEDESNPNYSDRQYTKISAKEGSWDYEADTIEDLLIQIGYEGEALETALASVERYNELCHAGYDEDFGKPASRMFALENPPFYASKWGTTSMLVCVGGLESDENCHTFTEGDPASPKRAAIPGLYVCGNVQGSRYAVEYPICLRGISHSLCVYYGYVAGKNCVAGV